ncbi:MAG TPA: winged helix-turn-helix transcriptional regulator [Clostridiales bacterium]|nr:winged helix-turn-helix transcriptional regulator [Clostridiales bacterium]
MKIVELMRQDSRITTVRLSEIIGISKRNIEANISDLKKKGIVERIGSRKNGYWEVTKDGNIMSFLKNTGGCWRKIKGYWLNQSTICTLKI